MLLKNKNGYLYLMFEKLAAFPEIRHGIFTRQKDYRIGGYADLNMSHSVGDDQNRVNLNRKVISRCIGGNGVVFAHQIHHTDILTIDETIQSFEINTESDSLTGDALVTRVPGKTIAIKLADCQAVLLYDPIKKIVAAVHSGWRGSIQNIIGRCINKMKDQFSCDPRHLIAGVSPSLGPCCSEFVNYKNEIPENLWKYKDDRRHFNFWEISRDQLFKAGVQAKNIELSNICTKCNSHMFFSYRQSKDTGRFAAAIGLK